MGNSSAEIRIGIPGVDLDGLGVVSDRPVVVVFLVIGIPPVGVLFGISCYFRGLIRKAQYKDARHYQQQYQSCCHHSTLLPSFMKTCKSSFWSLPSFNPSLNPDKQHHDAFRIRDIYRIFCRETTSIF
jgi:hypothetical protein